MISHHVLHDGNVISIGLSCSIQITVSTWTLFIPIECVVWFLGCSQGPQPCFSVRPPPQPGSLCEEAERARWRRKRQMKRKVVLAAWLTLLSSATAFSSAERGEHTLPLTPDQLDYSTAEKPHSPHCIIHHRKHVSLYSWCKSGGAFNRAVVTKQYHLISSWLSSGETQTAMLSIFFACLSSEARESSCRTNESGNGRGWRREESVLACMIPDTSSCLYSSFFIFITLAWVGSST